MGRPKKETSVEVLPQPKAPDGQTAQVPVQVIPPNLDAEGYDMGTVFIDATENVALKGVIFFKKVISDADARATKNVLAKSLTHFWEGTEREFRNQFDKAK